MNAATQAKYDRINRVSPHRVLSVTTNTLRYGSYRQWIEVQRAGRQYRTGEHLYIVRRTSEVPHEYGEVAESTYLPAASVAPVIRSMAQDMATIPQDRRLENGIADTLAYFGISR